MQEMLINLCRRSAKPWLVPRLAAWVDPGEPICREPPPRACRHLAPPVHGRSLSDPRLSRLRIPKNQRQNCCCGILASRHFGHCGRTNHQFCWEGLPWIEDSITISCLTTAMVQLDQGRSRGKDLVRVPEDRLNLRPSCVGCKIVVTFPNVSCRSDQSRESSESNEPPFCRHFALELLSCFVSALGSSGLQQYLLDFVSVMIYLFIVAHNFSCA